MSRGELIVDDNQIKPATGPISGDWADEYQTQYIADPNSWADQFVQGEASPVSDYYYYHICCFMSRNSYIDILGNFCSYVSPSEVVQTWTASDMACHMLLLLLLFLGMSLVI